MQILLLKATTHYILINAPKIENIFLKSIIIIPYKILSILLTVILRFIFSNCTITKINIKFTFER